MKEKKEVLRELRIKREGEEKPLRRSHRDLSFNPCSSCYPLRGNNGFISPASATGSGDSGVVEDLGPFDVTMVEGKVTEDTFILTHSPRKNPIHYEMALTELEKNVHGG